MILPYKASPVYAHRWHPTSLTFYGVLRQKINSAPYQWKHPDINPCSDIPLLTFQRLFKGSNFKKILHLEINSPFTYQQSFRRYWLLFDLLHAYRTKGFNFVQNSICIHNTFLYFLTHGYQLIFQSHELRYHIQGFLTLSLERLHSFRYFFLLLVLYFKQGALSSLQHFSILVTISDRDFLMVSAKVLSCISCNCFLTSVISVVISSSLRL